MNSNSEQSNSNKTNQNKINTGIAWCLAWGEGREAKHDLKVLKEMQKALMSEGEIPEEVSDIVTAVKGLEQLEDIENFPKNLDELNKLIENHPLLWESKIGLVYGGVTKVKQYVFEAPKLPDIRGASALLDRINLVDLPAFFGVTPKYDPKLNTPKYSAQCNVVRNWLNENFPKQSDDESKFSEVLIPELIIYSTGGNILAFCPAAFVDDLANAIEKRYTYETLTANSCAVGDCFKLLDVTFGLLRDNITDTFWLDKYRKEYKHPIVEACFGKIENDSNHDSNILDKKVVENFQNRKSFNELTTKLAAKFNQRRSGNDTDNRPTRRYPPMFETHPYLRRDGVEKRSAIAQVDLITGKPYLSEPAIRKRCIGDRAKKETQGTPQWYKELKLDWEPGIIENWTNKFEIFLQENPEQYKKYCKDCDLEKVETPPSLTHIGKVSNGFVAYIYADGNNMGGYIQKIRTPQQYQNFSEDVDNATKYSVYQALADKLHPRKLQGIDESTSRLKNNRDLIHPFEIVTIGGDDIIIIVPADKALEIAQMIGEQFEKILLKEVAIANVEIKDEYRVESTNKPAELNKIHRYSWETAPASQCKLSMSSGVLITSYNTPVYYAEKLTTQLLKSAKKRAKRLKKTEFGYCGGTVDFLVLKAVTMISSDIEEFRKKALVKERGAKLKLYAAPYTLHELEGLIKSVQALKKAEFPKSQIYQIRSFLERGKQTAILNYRYFRARLKLENSKLLKQDFEDPWCSAKTNGGNLAPWMFEPEEKIYETIWRELVDIYEFISKDDDSEINDETSNGINKQNIITTKTN
ncbi:type III-B CRISPR-associated protein Cas10/Cmr2 [Mastigocoleus testarum]|uniref:Type III-B CRISPR-associated protein Cas10/Cmr2 n=1 Tax=Mastigocoleus testarum BC008 TaxID=371196 RepID=A0A0V7ZV86_9CYAN|nr:type III-B CRISPR-associated protein Cas10/Cmr2 [Mastigocoleus testarum]KST68544.1 type III-B CRISPR-associated protein Cas10/Cmr2 [Mastigocoleus testarum BC008]KST68559.1 type III-B CRISPR-associated protein Cas10/Cmr2 [Mastigocoleus testarum BC008]